MGYRDLIHKLEMNRDYLREFYVYGFRNAKEVNKKSPQLNKWRYSIVLPGRY